MTTHTPKTQEQREFLTNVERAKAVGVETSTATAVYYALLGGLTYCNFQNGQVASLTDDYLVDCQDWLYNKAVDVAKQDSIKWVGME